jgi:hypothetical protein
MTDGEVTSSGKDAMQSLARMCDVLLDGQNNRAASRRAAQRGWWELLAQARPDGSTA